MAIVKRDFRTGAAEFIYDDAGDVVDLKLTVNYEIFDNTKNESITRVTETESVWLKLNNGERTSLNQHGKKLKTLGSTF